MALDDTKSTHTFQIFQEYLRCPSCGFIQEDRQDYEENFQGLFKYTICERCKKEYSKEKK